MSNMLEDARVAAVVTAGTGVVSTSSMFGFIPDDIGKLGTVIALVLSSVLIATHLRKANRETKAAELKAQKTQREIELLDKQLNDREKTQSP